MALNSQQDIERLVDTLHTALNAVKVLRSSVGHVFDTLGNGVRGDHGEEGKDNKFLMELQELLNIVTVNFREVEQAVNTLTPPPSAFSLGNTMFLSQESTQERQILYPQLVNCHKWTDKVHEYSNMAMTLLSQNSLKRSYVSSGSAKRRRPMPSGLNVPPQNVDQLLAGIDRQFTDMSLNVSRPFGSNVVTQVTLGRIMKGLVAFKGLMIEWVVIKGYTETLDMWTESRYKVFQKVNESAHAAMLHFHSPNLLEISVRSFMTWLHSYITLFSDPCKRCGNHLLNALPPTWRDLRALDPYHDECRP